ncbi:hypothetical protein Tsubulata_012709 [Turnera subulata]|uniref:FACT complex subunit n=1 Tax=Turnera subulata TaxID=218843 RepID=A0A9Q0GFH6_9ROSI|nr:hypothetical protein Tsubulata_012709 [Turnera subulata]
MMNNDVVPKLESVIDEEKKASHFNLMDEAGKAIHLDNAKEKLKAGNVDICYPPIFQSGGEFDLRPRGVSNDENLYYDSTTIGALKPGNSASAVYQSALTVAQNEAPELVPNLTKNVGTRIGLEFHELGLILNAKNDRVIKARMVFNVALGFQNLQNKADNPKIRKFSLLLAETLIIGSMKMMRKKISVKLSLKQAA